METDNKSSDAAEAASADAQNKKPGEDLLQPEQREALKNEIRKDFDTQYEGFKISYGSHKGAPDEKQVVPGQEIKRTFSQGKPAQ